MSAHNDLGSQVAAAMEKKRSQADRLGTVGKPDAARPENHVYVAWKISCYPGKMSENVGKCGKIMEHPLNISTNHAKMQKKR